MNFPYRRLEKHAIFTCRSELARESVQYSPFANARSGAGHWLACIRYALEPVTGMPVTSSRGSKTSINNKGENLMKNQYLAIAGCAGLLLAATTQAGSISCGDAIITDDQDEGQTTMQILDQCGQPTSQDGDTWLYDRSDVGQGTYILHFDDSGQLESIQQQMDED